MMQKRITELPDPEIVAEVGNRLSAARKSRGLTQAEAAERAGLDRMTVSRAERGENPTLLTVVRLLRVYGRLDALDAFLPQAEVSPLELIRVGRGRRGG